MSDKQGFPDAPPCVLELLESGLPLPQQLHRTLEYLEEEEEEECPSVLLIPIFLGELVMCDQHVMSSSGHYHDLVFHDGSHRDKTSYGIPAL